MCWMTLTLHTYHCTPDRSRALRNFALGAGIFVVVFQITLCLIVECAGISIIWCAMGGWIVSERKRLRDATLELGVRETRQDDQQAAAMKKRKLTANRLELMVILFDIGAIVDYATKSPASTTLAHICAIVLGAILSLISIRLFDASPIDTTMATTTASSVTIVEPPGITTNLLE